MGASNVEVVVGIFNENTSKVCGVDDQDVIQTFFSSGCNVVMTLGTHNDMIGL
jgi:hypothetical protein